MIGCWVVEVGESPEGEDQITAVGCLVDTQVRNIFIKVPR